MFCLWMSLICAAALMQSVSPVKAVKLNCSKTVKVEAGDTVTLNCTVDHNPEDPECEVLQVIWSNTSNKTLCYSGSNKCICVWNNQTCDPSLIISNVTKEENYTVTVETDCGDDTSMINVQVKHTDKQGPGDGPGSEQDVEPNTDIIAISVIGVVLVVSVMLFVLFKTNSHRKIIKFIKGQKTQDYSQTSAEPPADMSTSV